MVKHKLIWGQWLWLKTNVVVVGCHKYSNGETKTNLTIMLDEAASHIITCQ